MNQTSLIYMHGHSWLHRMDVRYKFILLCLFGISVLHARLFPLTGVILLFIFLFHQVRFPLLNALRQIKFFIFLIILVFITRAVMIPGKTLGSLWGIHVTDQGLYSGATVACRFFFIVLAGLLFYISTPPGQIKSTIQWFLKPIPFVPEKRVAVMASLTFGFLPLILKLTTDIRQAQDARCAQLNKNPVKRMIRLSVPLLKRTFLSADRLIMAMEARCYSEDRTDPSFFSSGRERLIFAAGLLVVALLLFF